MVKKTLLNEHTHAHTNNKVKVAESAVAGGSVRKWEELLEHQQTLPQGRALEEVDLGGGCGREGVDEPPHPLGSVGTALGYGVNLREGCGHNLHHHHLNRKAL